ncbi:5'-nucleotidase domain-containing protein 3 [Trichonephila clavipes]|nr:5'-nucleotidase domain-containing protein 3 [Trichonephila clavipes]
MQSLHPKPPKHHGKRPVFIHPGLLEATHVFLRRDMLRRPLQQPYDGPFKVLQRKDKVFFLDINGKRVSVSIDRCKPAFFLNTEDLQLPQTKNETPATVEPNATASTPATVESDPTASTPTQPSTRSGRKVHLPTSERIEQQHNDVISLTLIGWRGDTIRNTNRNSGSKVSDRDKMLEKYYVAKQAYEANLPPPEVDPFGVFANNELNLGDIDVYGFDYDYTLAVYKESLHYLIYELGRDWLVNKFKYPSGIQELPYQPGFAIRGLHYDMQEGILMKIDSFHQIQFESVFRGTTPLEKEEVVAIYGGSYIPQELIRGSSEGTRMKQLNDLFSVPEICLLSNVTEYFEKKNIPYLPEILSYDIQNAVQSIHPVMHKMLDESTIGQYLEKLPDMTKFLNRLKNAGKKMFLITNSPFKFVDTGMTYMIGPGWTDLFDVIVVQARKPKFFTDQSRPFRIYDVPTKSQLWEKVTSLQKGNVYMEGNLKELQRMTNWYGSSVLYFGDQIYSDLADLTLHHGWRTGAIIYELTHMRAFGNGPHNFEPWSSDVDDTPELAPLSPNYHTNLEGIFFKIHSSKICGSTGSMMSILAGKANSFAADMRFS